MEQRSASDDSVVADRCCTHKVPDRARHRLAGVVVEKALGVLHFDNVIRLKVVVADQVDACTQLGGMKGYIRSSRVDGVLRVCAHRSRTTAAASG